MKTLASGYLLARADQSSSDRRTLWAAYNVTMIPSGPNLAYLGSLVSVFLDLTVFNCAGVSWFLSIRVYGVEEILNCFYNLTLTLSWIKSSETVKVFIWEGWESQWNDGIVFLVCFGCVFGVFLVCFGVFFKMIIYCQQNISGFYLLVATISDWIWHQ